MKHAFIKQIETVNTGGNFMVDFITLEDGRILAISFDLIGLYENMGEFDLGNSHSMIER